MYLRSVLALFGFLSKLFIFRIFFFHLYSVSTYVVSVQYQEGLEPSKQRWFFGGKLLGDKLHIEDAKILPGYVVQVIVNAENAS